MILISPAKRLVDRENSSNLKSSEPIFQSEANKLAEHMATLSSKELQSLMGVSEDIAKLNQHRYNNWNNTIILRIEPFSSLKVMFTKT